MRNLWVQMILTGVASNDDELRLAASERLEGGLVAKGDCELGFSIPSSFPMQGRLFVPLPDFMTRARRLLMESAVFLLFFGAIFARQEISSVAS